jgi:hypothetical protein
MSFSDLEILAEKVRMPRDIMDNLSYNDDLRRNLLLTNCLTLEKQGMMWSDFHEDE